MSKIADTVHKLLDASPGETVTVSVGAAAGTVLTAVASKDWPTAVGLFAVSLVPAVVKAWKVGGGWDGIKDAFLHGSPRA